MSLSTPILTVTCCACALPHASAAPSAATANRRFIAFLRGSRRRRRAVFRRRRLSWARAPADLTSPADQRASPILERTECFPRRDSSAQLVEVAGIFRLGRRLHLEQVGRLDLAAVGADRARA